MKISLKKITLKQDTLDDIQRGEVDPLKYVQTIKTNLDAANYLVDTKLLALDDLELYAALSKLFHIELDENDVLSILKSKYGKHYSGMIALSTNMVDEEGNNVMVIGASTKKGMNAHGFVSLDELRRLVNSYDFIVLENAKTRPYEKVIHPVPFEDYQFEHVSSKMDDSDGLFDLKTQLLAKQMKDRSTLKRVLSLVDQFTQELIHQAKAITRLDEEDESMREISQQYRKAYTAHFTKKSVSKKGKHQKSH